MSPWFRPALATAPPSPATDFATPMGPRNRRRFMTGAVGLGAVAATCVLALWFFGGLPFVHTSNHSDSSTPVERVITLIPQRPGLAYGMTKQRMIKRLGKPERTAGQCLQYPENIKNFADPPQLINAVRLCFYAGQYQVWFQELDGIWRGSDGLTDKIEPPTTVTPVPLNKTIPDWSKRPHE